VDSVRDSSQEQASGITQIARTVNHMQEVTQSTASGAEESAAAAEELAAQSQSLRSVISELRALVG
jgi:methyl-accepting chemotaxis protein